MDDAPDRMPGRPGRVLPPVQPLPVSTQGVILAGIGCWVVALVVTIAVPSLHTGVRDWWPWAAVAGIVLGATGYAYVARGRGNAADPH